MRYGAAPIGRSGSRGLLRRLRSDGRIAPCHRMELPEQSSNHKEICNRSRPKSGKIFLEHRVKQFLILHAFLLFGKRRFLYGLHVPWLACLYPCFFFCFLFLA